ncbi:WD40 repeat domain-containing protein [Streptomyces roseoverticillatus]|uniref:WD40 repeat domain-containing protein n=1 Tax=Streptomyces roseoverticillatus TaxID=66429 RepID=A0ABV3IXA9_9ACTN
MVVMLRPSLHRSLRRRVLRNVLLLGLAVVSAVVAAQIYSSGEGRAAGIDHLVAVLGFFVSVASLVVAVADYFRTEEPVNDPAVLADDLAGTVCDQWSQEATERSLRDPRVLPLSWKASARAVVDTATLLATSMTLATVVGLAMAAHHWLNAPPTRSAQADPLAFVQQDRRSALVGALAAGMVAGTTFVFALALGSAIGEFGIQAAARRSRSNWLSWPALVSITEASYHKIANTTVTPAILLVGTHCLLPGVVVTLLVLISRAWSRFLIVRVLLALRGNTPWRLMAFLSDARQRGLLRQSGGTYQFRHVRLQEQLASGPSPLAGTPAPSSAITRRRLVVGASAAAALGMLGEEVSVTALPRDTSLSVLNGAEPRAEERGYATTGLVFSHDNHLLAVAGEDGTTRVYSWKTEELVSSLRVRNHHYSPEIDRHYPREMIFTPNNFSLILNHATERGVRENIEHYNLRGHRHSKGSNKAAPVAVSGNGRVLAAAERSGLLQLWEFTEDGWSIARHQDIPDLGIGPIHSLALSHDGRYLAAGNATGSVSCWNRKESTAAHAQLPDPVNIVSVSYDGTLTGINTLPDTRIYYSWNSATRQHATADIPLSWAISGDGKTLAARTESDGLHLWDTSSGQKLPISTSQVEAVDSILALSRNGRLLALSSHTPDTSGTYEDEAQLQLWDLRRATPQCRTLTGHIKEPIGAAFSRDGKFLATSSNDGTVRVWQV